MIRPQFQVGIFQESSTLPPQADPAAVPSRLFSVRNLKRVRTQNGGDFHVHVALREAMHDRRIADIERALIAGEECSGRSSKLHYPSLDHRWACRIQLDLGRNACTRWSWNMQDTLVEAKKAMRVHSVFWHARLHLEDKQMLGLREDASY